jgi:hypothetical protein
MPYYENKYRENPRDFDFLNKIHLYVKYDSSIWKDRIDAYLCDLNIK